MNVVKSDVSCALFKILRQNNFAKLYVIIIFNFICALNAAANTPNSLLANIQENTWVNLNAPIETNLPGSVSSGTLAYSGMTYDSINHKLLLFGGGHNDGYDDRVWAFDFDTLKWSPEYESSGNPLQLSPNHFDQENYPGVIFDPVGESIADAHPVSLHTYDNLTFITTSPSNRTINEMFMVGASSYRGANESPQYWPKHPDYTWTYNTNTKKWTWLDKPLTRNRNGLPSAKGTTAQYDPSTGLVYLFRGDKNPSEVWTYNIDTDKWDLHDRLSPVLGIELGSAYVDRVGDPPAIYLFGGEYGPEDVLFKYEISTKRWTEMPTGSVKPPGGGGYGLVYDSKNDVLLAYLENSSMYAYRFDTQVWEKLAQGPINTNNPSKLRRVHGNLQYDPINNVAILVRKASNFGTETWAYKYKKQPTDLSAPSFPLGLNVSQVTETSVQLIWMAANDPESGINEYRIYRNGQVIGTSNNLSFNDTGLSEANSYAYQVSAVNGSGLESALSVTASITTLADSTPPTVVSTSVSNSTPTVVSINFSEPIEQNSAQNIGNYQVSDNGLVSRSILVDNLSTVELILENLASGTLYEISIDNLLDRSSVGNPILPNTKTSFFLDNDDGAGELSDDDGNAGTNGDTPFVKISTGNNAAQTVPVTFGQVFKPGYIPQGLTLTTGTPLQVDGKTFYADGSLKHAILTTEVPSGTDTTLSLDTKPLSLQNSSLDLNNLISSGYNLNVTLNISGTTYTASAVDFLQSSNISTWLSGPLVSEWIVSGSPSSGSTNHPYLTVHFHVRYYRDGRVRTDVKLENTKTFLDKQTITYDVMISQNGQTVYSKSSLDHYMHGFWRKRVWWKASGDADPQSYVQHDMAYIRATKVVPNYKQDVTITNNYLQGLTQNIEPMEIGDLRSKWATAGSSDQKAPFPRWTATYLLTGDERAFNSVVANSDALGTFSLNYRDENTGLPTRIDDYNPTVGITNLSGGIPDNGVTSIHATSNYRAHQPSLGYVAYLVTGDYCHLETTWFLGNYNLLFASPGKKNGQAGEFLRDKDYELRGWAWALRALGHAAYATPDDHPLKPYFVDRVNNNLNYINVNFANNPAYTGFNLGAIEPLIPFATKSGGPRHWMYWFFGWSVGHLSELGFAADPVRNWSAKLAAGMMGSDDGYCYQFASRNKSELGPNISVAFQSFQELYNNNSQAQTSLPCGSQALASWMNQNISGEGDSLIAGQMLGNTHIPDGWYANMQPALAIAVDSGVAGQVEWDRFTGKSPNWSSKVTDYADAPQFAIVPRAFSSSPPQPPTDPAPVINISANPASVAFGESSEISWSSVNATSCQSISAWTNNTATNGKQNITPQQTTTYSISCEGAGGTITASATITVAEVDNPNSLPPPAAPEITISADPSNVNVGESSLINWSSKNTTSCRAVNGWTTSSAITGSQVVTPQVSTTYTLNCEGAGGTITASATITVAEVNNPNPLPPPAAPEITISADPSNVNVGESSLINWSSKNTTSCRAVNGWTTSSAITGSQVVTPQVSTTYTLNCEGAGGISSVSVTISAQALPANSSPLRPLVSVPDNVPLQGHRFTIVGQYSDPDGDPMQQAQWQVATNQNFSTSSMRLVREVSNNTNLSVPTGLFLANTNYWIRTRHQDSKGLYSEWSEAELFLTESQYSNDADGNGIDDAFQADGFVDTNNNGENDIDEGMCNLLAVDGVKPLGFQSSNGQISCHTTINSSNLASTSTLNLPYGLFGFSVRGINPGASIQVVIYLPESSPTNSKWLQLDEVSGNILDLTPNTTFENERVLITYVDGGLGDADGQANGIIIDPSGLAATSGGGSSVNAADSSGGGGAMHPIFAILILFYLQLSKSARFLWVRKTIVS